MGRARDLSLQPLVIELSQFFESVIIRTPGFGGKLLKETCR